MKQYYCWRSKHAVPMLEEHEWEMLEPLLSLKSVKDYRKANNASIKEATEVCFQKALDKYFELTGFKETNHNALWYRRLSKYGSECPDCGYLLRTPRAKYCANCGYIKSGT